MFSREGSVILLLCPSIFTVIDIRIAILHLFELGKSKTRIKKITKSMPFIEKVNLKGYVERCEFHRKAAVRIRKFYLIYLLVLISGLAVMLLSLIVAPLRQIADYWGGIKFLCLDVPFTLFSMFMPEHDRKHGGVTWKWKAE